MNESGEFLLKQFVMTRSQGGVPGADWLSRLPLSVDVTGHQKTAQREERELELEKVLQQTKGNQLDLPVTISAKGHRARLVAVRGFT